MIVGCCCRAGRVGCRFFDVRSVSEGVPAGRHSALHPAQSAVVQQGELPHRVAIGPHRRSLRVERQRPRRPRRQRRPGRIGRHRLRLLTATRSFLIFFF